MTGSVPFPPEDLRKRPSLNDGPACGYRLFGDLFLERPEKHLDKSALKRLEQIEPHLHGLLHRRHYSTDWKYSKEFESAAQNEVALWADMGVSRPKEFLIPPEGPQDALVSLHLHNSSFSVKDPSSKSTCDQTNFSICQITQIGFSPRNCLWYDHLFRREALDGLQNYPDEIVRIHETFNSDLRKHMGAVVDICWGSCVKKRMQKTLCLEPLQLWGEFQEVTIWLEWEVSSEVAKGPRHELKRFVVFVMHPEAMLYASRPGQVRLQDQHLTAAARLGGMSINEHFYEVSHRPGSYGRLLKVEWSRQKDNNKQAIREVQQALAHCDTSSVVQRKRKTPAVAYGPEEFQNFTGAPENFKLGEVLQSDSDNGDHMKSQNEYQTATPQPINIHPEIQSLVKGPQGLKYLMTSLIDDEFCAADAIALCTIGLSQEFDLFSTGWDAIPTRLKSWLQAQDGLKIDGQPIDSADSLLKAQQLLTRTPCTGKKHIFDIVLKVAIRYFKQVRLISEREKMIVQFTVPGCAPVARKCGSCGARLLDDPYPRFKKLEPSRYVARYLKIDCGSGTCSPSSSCNHAVPVDAGIPWSAPEANCLRRPPAKAAWSDILIRKTDNVNGLPNAVECICSRCESSESIFMDSNPRWTIETNPRYIARKPRCKACKNTSTTHAPLDPAVEHLDAAALSKKWAQFTAQNWTVEELRQSPDRFFPTKRVSSKEGRKQSGL